MIDRENLKAQLLERKEHPEQFFELLHQVWLEGRSTQVEAFFPEVLSVLSREEGLDVPKLALDAINGGQEAWDILHILGDCFAGLSLKISSILPLYRKLHEDTQNDMLSWLPYELTAKLTRTQAGFARQLLAVLEGIDEPFVTGHLQQLLIELSKDNETEIHQKLCSLSSSAFEYVLIAVMFAFTKINYGSIHGAEQLQKTVRYLELLEGRESPLIKMNLAACWQNFLETPSLEAKAKEKLLACMGTGIPEIDFALSKVLSTQSDRHGGEAWFAEILLSLSNTSSEHKGIIKNLDMALCSMASRNSNWPLIQKFLLAWISESDFKASQEDLSRLFASTFNVFIKHGDQLNTLVTSLLIQEKPKGHEAAAEIVGDVLAYKGPPLVLDKKLLAPLGYDDLLFIARKILGYIVHEEALYTLIFSLLEVSSAENKASSIVFTVFLNHLAPDYPEGVIEFLNTKVVSSNEETQKLIQDVTDSVSVFLKELSALPRLKETQPPTRMSYAIALEKHKSMQEVMEKAQGRSVIMSICSRLPLKCGKGSFSFSGGQYTPVSNLTAISASFSLPRSEFTHPVSAAMERVGFRIAKKGQP